MALLTAKQVAAELSVTTSTIYRWVADKKIPYVSMPNGFIRFNQIHLNR